MLKKGKGSIVLETYRCYLRKKIVVNLDDHSEIVFTYLLIFLDILMHFTHFCQFKYCEGEAKLGGCLVWRRADAAVGPV